jgi:ribonucleoside-triphosphate reductase
MKINPSAAATCMKPGGNSGVFLDVSHPITGRFSRYQIRRVRVGEHEPVCKFLIDQGVPHERDYVDKSLFVFSFPKDNGNGMTKDDLSTIEQLENWLFWKKTWCEHNPSCTIFVGPDEWMAAGEWVLRNWDFVGGLSFLPRNDHVYQQAPNEALTKEQFEGFASKFPEVRWERLPLYETEDRTTLSQEFACVAGACELDVAA